MESSAPEVRHGRGLGSRGGGLRGDATVRRTARSSSPRAPSSTRRSWAPGGIVAGEPRLEAGGELHDALEQLRRLGLVRLDPTNDTWVAEDPGLVHSRVVAPLSQQGAELLQESASWAQAVTALTQAWRRAPNTSERGPFRYLHGVDEINAFLQTIVHRGRGGGAHGAAPDRP